MIFRGYLLDRTMTGFNVKLSLNYLCFFSFQGVIMKVVATVHSIIYIKSHPNCHLMVRLKKKPQKQTPKYSSVTTSKTSLLEDHTNQHF